MKRTFHICVLIVAVLTAVVLMTSCGDDPVPCCVDESGPGAKLNTVGTFASPGYSRKMAVRDDRLYISAQDAGLVVWDISDPMKPIKVGEAPTSDLAYHTAFNGDYAYVSTSGIDVFNVAGGGTPTFVRTVPIDGGCVERCSVRGSRGIVSTCNGIYFLNTSDPSSPVVVDSLASLGTYDARFIDDDLAVATSEHLLYLLDLSNFPNAAVVDTLVTNDFIYGLYVSGNRVFAANRYHGLLVVDVSGGSSLESRGSFFTGGNARDVCVIESKAYVASSEDEALYVVDVANPAKMSLIEKHDLPGSKGVDATSEYVYVAGADDGFTVMTYNDVPSANGLEGVWVGHEVDGSPYDWTFTIAGNQMRIESTYEWYEGTYTTNASASPKQLDFLISDGSESQYVGQTSLGIYKIEGNTLTWAGNGPGVTTRPSDFTPGEARVFVVTKQ